MKALMRARMLLLSRRGPCLASVGYGNSEKCWNQALDCDPTNFMCTGTKAQKKEALKMIKQVLTLCDPKSRDLTTRARHARGAKMSVPCPGRALPGKCAGPSSCACCSTSDALRACRCIPAW